MNNKNQPHTKLAIALSLALGAGTCSSALAEIPLHDEDGTTFSADGLINTFYVNSDINNVDNSLDRQQARVKMGFNMTKQAGDLKRVAEIDRTETPTRETDTVAIGAVLSW